MTHECSKLKAENSVRYFEEESGISFQFDEIGGIVYQVVGLERIRIDYCPFCGMSFKEVWRK